MVKNNDSSSATAPDMSTTREQLIKNYTEHLEILRLRAEITRLNAEMTMSERDRILALTHLAEMTNAAKNEQANEESSEETPANTSAPLSKV